jgi:hypothetical protein
MSASVPGPFVRRLVLSLEIYRALPIRDDLRAGMAPFAAGGAA